MKLKDRKPLTYFTNQINFDKVREEIENSPLAQKHFTLDNFRTVREGVFAACEKWLVRDAYEFTIDKVEETTLYLPKELEEFPGAKAIIDVQGTLKGTQAPFKDYVGSVYALDWKTTSGSLSSDWRGRYIDSWQWQLYSEIIGASIFIYRGYSWSQRDTKEIIIKVPPYNREEVIEYLKGVLLQRKALVDAGLDVWPRAKPKSCNAFGRECDFYSDCSAYSMPRGARDQRILSYSRIEEFLLCPERARRGELIEIEGIEVYHWEAEMGSAFHRGMAEVYRQLKTVEVP